MRRTAGIIIIGDEILSGKVEDSNSPFMAKALRPRGIEVRKISVIPDEVDEIAKEVRELSSLCDLVFTSGGIGPTHDDVTIEGIAKAFGVRTVIDGLLRESLLKIYSELTPERLRMAEVPEGAEVINDGTLNVPVILFRNIYIFPGIPELLRKKFLVIIKPFNEPPLLLRKVYLNEYESEIAPLLNEIVRNYRAVKIGSYPVMDNRDYCVMVTFESLDEGQLDSAVKELTERLPQDKVVRVES